MGELGELKNTLIKAVFISSMLDIYNSHPYVDYMLKFIIRNCHGADFPVFRGKKVLCAPTISTGIPLVLLMATFTLLKAEQ